MAVSAPDIKIVIPARLQSSRLPKKVMQDIAGKSMLEWVWLQAVQSDMGQVIIAVDEQEVLDLAESFGAEVCMTQATHVSGTDRCYEVAETMGWSEETRIVNLQADEPLMPSVCLQQIAALSMSYDIAACSLFEWIDDGSVFHDPNVVKVLCDHDDRALYFSRAALPYRRESDEPWPARSRRRHIGLYAYPVHVLRCFTQLQNSTYEQLEKLEQLRLLEAGVSIQMAEACAHIPAGVDTLQDLERVRRQWPES